MTYMHMTKRMPRPFRLALHLLLLGLAFLVTACSDEGPERRRSLGKNPSFSDFMRVADAERGSRLFSQCAACHTVKMGAGDRNGPALYDVLDKPVASNSRRFAYTGALRSLGGVWTSDRMDVWLAAPAKLAPGTSMSFRGIPDPLDRADIITFLQTQSADRGSAAALP